MLAEVTEGKNHKGKVRHRINRNKKDCGKKNLCLSISMDCIHLSKGFLLVFNVPEIMCLVFECSPPRKAVSHSSNYHIPKGSWLMISLWTTWSFRFYALPQQFPIQ